MAAGKITVASILAAACTTATQVKENITSAPTPAHNDPPTYWPTYWPTYAPTAVEELRSLPSVRCPDSFESFVEIDNVASMQYSIVQSDDPQQSGILCARLLLKSADDGWAAIAFSENGKMEGSDAVVAVFEQESVLKYHLGGKDPAAVVVMEDAKQTLQDTYVGVFGTIAVVEFTKLLVEENEVTINGEGVNIFLHARGDVWPGYHASRTVFVDVVKKTRSLSIACDETRPCPNGEYCKLEPGKCFDAPETQVGVCTRIHDNCIWPVDYLPVCGCDKQTYGNACEVDESGTSVAYLGFCELAERQVDLSPINLSCPENQCLDPDGKCDEIVNCFVDPCDVQEECAYAECEANYCGGCHHVCSGNFTKISDEILCLAEWAPVCGDDNITYPNSCEANKANAKILHEGKCKVIAIVQPEEECSPGGRCSSEGSSCSVGTETCCGETYDSLKCDCFGGSWMCFHTEACMFPSCCANGPPKDKPAPSMDFCVSGQACDTDIEDDYCCNDMMKPGNTYCTKSGGMSKEPEDTLPTTTEATVAATTTYTTTTTTEGATTTSKSQTTSSAATTSEPSSTTLPETTSSATNSTTTTTPQTTSTDSTEDITTTTTITTAAPQTTSTNSTGDGTTATAITTSTAAPQNTGTNSTGDSTTTTVNTTTTTITAPQTSTNSTEDSSTNTANTTTTTAPQTTSTFNWTIFDTLGINSVASTNSTVQAPSTLAADSDFESTNATSFVNSTSSTTATSTTIAPSTTTAFNFDLDFSTTAPESRSGLVTTTELTTTEPTPIIGTGTIEGRPNSPNSSTSDAGKNVVRLLSLSSVCLVLAACRLM
eukprot:scaffold6677_cov155-Skeletonema_menzelii.AAC.20